MRFFDGHCDTILKIVERGADMAAPPGSPSAPHVTLAGLRDASVGAQVFACCVVEARHPGRTREHALELVGGIRALCAAHPDELALANAPRVVADAFRESAPSGSRMAPASRSRTAVIIALEGADPLQGEPQALRDFHAQGVRLLTLAWDDNPFCGASAGESGAGLSEKGAELVALCEELGVVVDVSHASDAAFWDVCRVATRPFVASHSDCRAVSASRRNLTDQMIRALAERGGVMGINLESGFLDDSFRRHADELTASFWASVRSGEKTFDEAGEEVSRGLVALPRPPLDAVTAHVVHAINVGGEDCVGLGGDLDGIDSMPRGIDGVHDYPRLAAALLAAGLTERRVEKVCWRNWARLWSEAG